MSWVSVFIAIRTGRYTHTKRAADIIEVKSLENNIKVTKREKECKALIKAIHKGVEGTIMVDLLTTHHSKLKRKMKLTHMVIWK